MTILHMTDDHMSHPYENKKTPEWADHRLPRHTNYTSTGPNHPRQESDPCLKKSETYFGGPNRGLTECLPHYPFYGGVNVAPSRYHNRPGSTRIN